MRSRSLAAWTLFALVIVGDACAAEVPANKGALLFAGGALRFDNAAVWGRFIDLAGGKGASVVVVPAAAGNPRASGMAVVENLRRHGARASLVPIAPRLTEVPYRAAAADPANVAMLRQAGGVWFIGGEQRRITTALLDDDGRPTPALEAIRHAYRQGAVVGGSSAGAAVLSRLMFADALNAIDTLKHGVTRGKEIDTGLGFLPPDWFVDQHFLAHGRFARALLAMREAGFKYGLGVDEDTAVVYRQGRFDVLGHNGVVFLDLRTARCDPSLPAFNLTAARLSYLESGDSLDATRLHVRVSKAKAEGRLDWRGKTFLPSFDRPEDFYVPDMLASGAIYRAMRNAIDSTRGVVRGLAFAQPEGGTRNDLAFTFRVYRGDDTAGWYTGKNGYEAYTLLNVYVDITPVKLARPLYAPLR